VLLAALVLPRCGLAAELDQEPAWKFSFVPYFWLPELHGDATVAERKAEVDVGFDDIFDLMFDGDLLGGMGHFEARNRRFTFLTDAVGTVIDPSKTGNRGTAEFDADLLVVEFGLAYRIFEGSLGAERTWSVEPTVGGRYVRTHADITIETSGGPVIPPSERSRETTQDGAEPFLGSRFHFNLFPALSWNFAGNVGGFGAASDLSWEIASFLGYTLPWKLGPADLDVFAGYRLLDFEFEDGNKELNVQMRGPLLGTGFRF
jgi:hypothetical protein